MIRYILRIYDKLDRVRCIERRIIKVNQQKVGYSWVQDDKEKTKFDKMAYFSRHFFPANGLCDYPNGHSVEYHEPKYR